MSKNSSLWYLGDNHTVDMVLICKGSNGLPHIALVERRFEPFAGQWAFPGGFISGKLAPGNAFVPAETPEEAVKRELMEETTVNSESQNLFSVGIYDDPGRDPRAGIGQRVVTHAFLIILKDCPSLQGKDDARRARWFSLKDVLNGQPPLAFDHYKILQEATGKYQGQISLMEYGDLTHHPSAVHAMKLPIPISVRFAMSNGTIETREGSVSYEKNDAILTGTEGESWSVSRKQFDLTYEPSGNTIPNTDGQYVKKPLDVLAVQLHEPLDIFVNDKRGKLHGNDGDWLIEYGPGKHGIVSKDIFDKTYRIL